MTEMDVRRGMAAQARHWLGRKEADGSHKEIIDIYNQIQPLPNGYRMKYTDPWCAAFLSAVAWLQGVTKVVFPSASCPDMVTKYKAAGRWMENDSYMPQIADVVFYDWDDSGSGDNAGTPDHVGLVVDIFSGSFNVIEGNASDSVKIRTMSRNGRYIRGFGLPDYAAVAGSDEIIVEPEPDPEPDPQPDPQPDPEPEQPVLNPDTPSGDRFTLQFTILRYGDGMKGRVYLREPVRALQRNIKALGFDVGPDGLDGEFGYNTLKALKAYQRSVQLDPDGEAGPLTYAALNGLM